MNTILSASLVVWCLAGAGGPEDIAHDRVDLVELNHFFDENGGHVFDQLIFYDWSAAEGRFQVRAWRLVKSPSQTPVKSPHHDGYDTFWHDGEVLRRVQSAARRETWTQYDPEVLERRNLPKESRRELGWRPYAAP